MKYYAEVEGQTFEIEINRDGEIMVDGQPHAVDIQSIGDLALYSLLVDHVSHEAFIEEREGEYRVLLQGELYTVSVQDELSRRLAKQDRRWAAPQGEIAIRAPMPGLVVTVSVEAGQAVKERDVLVVLESMKMENELRAPRDGTVRDVRATAGQEVEQDAILVTIG